MKTGRYIKLLVSCFTVFVFITSASLIYAEEKNITSIYKTDSKLLYYDGISADIIYAFESINANSSVRSDDSGGIYGLNWHRILGWSTIGMTVVTLGSGAIISKSGHCPLSIVTAGLATATCITGYYKYGSMISFKDGRWQYNTHAVMGTLATIGFVATIFLAGDDGSKAHVASGAASGLAFVITIGVLYF